MTVSRKNPPAAPMMVLPPNASFPELVVWHLPLEAWIECKKSFLRLGTCIVGEYYLFELYKTNQCSEKDLLRAWSEWYRLGLYENGEEQRRNLLSHSFEWGEQVTLYVTYYHLANLKVQRSNEGNARDHRRTRRVQHEMDQYWGGRNAQQSTVARF